MKNTQAKYWMCQLGGWFLYALTMLFFAYLFDQNLSAIFWKRIVLLISLGLILTHILRFFIHRYKLLPPLKGNMWAIFFLLVVLTCVAYSFMSSVLIQWFGWYRKELNGNIGLRFLYTLFDVSPIIFVWSSIYYLWHYVEDARNQEVDKIKLESLVKELALKTIKSHINPHFIFNALNSIRALVDENPERARTAITELSNLLRSSMQADKAETTSLECELNIVKDYLALEHIRFEDRLQIEYDIDEDTLDQPVPPMMLQTLVENAIKHGISKTKEGGLIKIISDFKGNHHELVVQNTGTLNGSYNVDGFGISSTQNRLQLLFGNKASFELKDIQGNRVQAKVEMPVAM
jgi:sensor histidine kinase YesM